MEKGARRASDISIPQLLHLFDFWHSVVIFHRGRVFNCIGKKLRASCEWLPATRLRVRGWRPLIPTQSKRVSCWGTVIVNISPLTTTCLVLTTVQVNTCWFCELKKSQILIFISIKRSVFCSCCDRLAGLWKNGDHGELVSPQGVQETCRRRHRTDYQRSSTTIGSSSPCYQKIKDWSKPSKG